MCIWSFLIVASFGLILSEQISHNVTARLQEPRLLVPQSSAKVVFSVAWTTKQQVQTDEVMKYDRVNVNVGNGYDVSRGVFVCPVSGVYLFHLHGFSEKDQSLWLELYHNHNQVMTVYCHEASGYESCSNTVALLLVKGDEIKIVSRASSTVYAVLSRNEVYNTFTGYLITTESPNIQPVLG